MMKAVSLNACVAQNGILGSVLAVVVVMRAVVDLVHCMVVVVVVVVANGHCKSRPSHFGVP